MRFNTPTERTEFEKTIGREARINRYRHLCHLSEDFQITEENLDKQIFSRICVESGCNPHMFKAQLLGKDEEYWGQDI